jgi:hypothetical protein
MRAKKCLRRIKQETMIILGQILCVLSGTIQHYLTNYLRRHSLFVYVPGVKGIKFDLGFIRKAVIVLNLSSMHRLGTTLCASEFVFSNITKGNYVWRYQFHAAIQCQKTSILICDEKMLF